MRSAIQNNHPWLAVQVSNFSTVPPYGSKCFKDVCAIFLARMARAAGESVAFFVEFVDLDELGIVGVHVVIGHQFRIHGLDGVP